VASPGFQLSVEAGQRLFEARRYHEAHEAFEDGWRVCRADEKRVLQVLVLWSAALFQVERGRGEGARRLLGRALERLGGVKESFDGLDVDSLKTCVIDTWGQLVAHEPLAPVWPAPFQRGPELSTPDHRSSCPYCGAPVIVTVAAEDSVHSQYVEDCPVCCRSWAVQVRDDRVDLRRLDG
jgi:hypothetical protein